MANRAWARAVLALAAAGAVAACANASRTARAPLERPNIVLIVAEDLSPRIGAYGDALASTPNIDQLAEEGVLFTRMFATSGVCAPSRAALITGMHQEAIGAQHMRASSFGRERETPLGVFGTDGYPYETAPPPHVKAFPEYLRAAGYVALNNAKTDYQFGTPFSVWDRSGRDVTLDARAPERPFFLMLSQAVTHESRLFRPDRARVTAGAADRAAAHEERFEPGFPFTDPAAVTVPPYLPDTWDVRADIARQYDNVVLLDRWVGEVMADLRARQLLDHTIVIFTTDHGDGLPRAKRSIYDSGLHVPFIVRFPDGRDAGARRDDLVSFVDLAPTIMALAGVTPPAHLHGGDMLDPERPPRPAVYAARDRLDELPDRSRAVRDERYKYIRNYVADRPVLGPLAFRENLMSMQSLRAQSERGALTDAQARLLTPQRPAEELYDLAADPHETVNLAAAPEHGRALARLRAMLDAHAAAVGDLGEVDERAMVETLFWPGGAQPRTGAPSITLGADGAVRLASATQGASIGYRLCGPEGCADGAPWRLYAEPVRAPTNGAAMIEAKAVRYGYEESSVSQRTLAAGP
ncbi:MAG: sulfatase [Caulobacterales bacterium]|nr:sulfatase [Caulobacterales bacterium]